MDLYQKKRVYSTTTNIIKKTLNPNWDQEFIFRVVPAKQKLVNDFCVHYDSDPHSQSKW